MVRHSDPATVAASKAGAAAAHRLFLSTPLPARTLCALNTASARAPLSMVPVFNTVVPYGNTAPCCFGCGAPISWEKLACAGTRLPLAMGGFYACCDACDAKNQSAANWRA